VDSTSYLKAHHAAGRTLRTTRAEDGTVIADASGGDQNGAAVVDSAGVDAA
jgi:hypothetical protein